MSKLYLFGIGGTGARVIRSLTMILASGVRCGSTDTIIPILIDPDQANGDLTRTITLLNTYKQIRKGLTFGGNAQSDFFSMNLDDGGVNFRMPVANVSGKTFEQYIGYSTLDKSNKALISLLFSDDNLSSDLDVGFKGNPNMGSIVLNNFNNGSLKDVLVNFQDGDRIFIISSIFGGTGAAGFPLLLKTLRQVSAPQYNNSQYIKNATIGAITVLPYFGVKSDAKSKIQMQTFISKTKSALVYYENNIDVDALYYITDKLTSSYNNNEGSIAQINNAHFVELASALAIVDFLRDNTISHNGQPVYKEFAIVNDDDPVSLKSLCMSTRNVLSRNLTQMFFMSVFCSYNINESLKHAWAENKIDNSDMTKTGFSELLNFLSDNGQHDGFLRWLKELASNSRAFAPYDLGTATQDFLHSIVGFEPPKPKLLKKLFHTELKGFDALEDQMERVSIGLKDKGMSKMDYFMSVFYQATSELIKNKFNL